MSRGIMSQELGERHLEKEIRGQKGNTFKPFLPPKISVAGTVVILLIPLLQC